MQLRARGHALRALRLVKVRHQVGPRAPRRWQVQLVEHNHLRLGRQLRRERRQLGLDGVEGADDGRRAALRLAIGAHLAGGGAVEQMHQHAAAHAVRKEGVAQPHAQRGALDQTRDVRKHLAEEGGCE